MPETVTTAVARQFSFNFWFSRLMRMIGVAAGAIGTLGRWPQGMEWMGILVAVTAASYTGGSSSSGN
jgi:hypothetical protein